MADAYGLLLYTYMGGRAVTGCEYAVYFFLEKIYAA